MEIQDILQEVFNSEFIKKRYFELKKQNTADFSERDFLSGIANYCVILKSKEDVEVFANIDKNSDRVEFLKEKIAQRLGIKNNSNNEKEIFKYACNKLYTEGFVFHVTNSVDAKEIMKNGFDSNKKPLNDELVKIGRILKKYNAASLIGWRQFDDEQSKGWFYSGTIGESEHYSNSPEWLSQLCGESMFYNIDNITKSNAYLNRDYVQAKDNIENAINKIKMNDEDKSVILNFFENAWERYEYATPQVILVPRKSINKTHNGAGDFFEPKKYFEKLLSNKGIFSNDNNANIEKNTNPEELTSIDLSNMFLSENRIKESKSNNEKILQHGVEQQEEQLTFEEMLELEIKKVVSSIDVKQYTGMTYSEQDSFDNKIKDVWMYMSIFKSNKGID